MIRPHLQLNNLRAFEASARHLSFSNAAVELHVTPAALSHQVKAPEDRLGFALFRRLPRGLALTDEGLAMLPTLSESFDSIAVMMERVTGRLRGEIVSLGVVGTFAVSWLFPRLAAFERAHPDIDLRISTNNNRVDIAEEGLDFAIRFGNGAWQAIQSTLLFAPPFAPMCAPSIAARLHAPSDILSERLLRSYRVADWSIWFEHAGVATTVIRGPMFDSSRLIIDAAIDELGVALAPPAMFKDQLRQGILCQPFELEVPLGAYYLTQLKSQSMSLGKKAFLDWLVNEARENVV